MTTSDDTRRRQLKVVAVVAALGVAGALVTHGYLTGAQWIEFAVRALSQITP